MTPEQLATLKAAILAVPELAAKPMNSDGDYDIAAAINQTDPVNFIVWKTSVSIDEIMRNGMDWARVDNLSVGKARIWEWLGKLGTIDPSKTNVRAGIDAAWGGTSADLAVRAAIYVHCKRAATTFEKWFSTGIGSDAVPAIMEIEGPVSYNDVGLARNS